MIGTHCNLLLGVLFTLLLQEPEVRIPVTQGIVGCVATTGELKTANQRACQTKLDNHIQAAFYRRHKGSYGVPLSLRSLFRTRVLVTVLLVLCVRETLCDVYIIFKNLIMSVYWTSHPTDNTVVLAEPKLGDLILSPLISIVRMLVPVVKVEISEQSAVLLT